MSEIKTDNQITVHGALKHIAFNIFTSGTFRNPAEMRDLVHKQKLTKEQWEKISEYVNALPGDIGMAVGMFLGGNSRVMYKDGILANLESVQAAVNIAAKLNDKDDKLLFYQLAVQSYHVLDPNSLGRLLLNVARLAKTPAEYNRLLNGLASERAELSNNQIKEVFQEYYDLKKQEILATLNEDIPNINRIKSFMWDGDDLARLTKDDETKEMARVLGNDLAQMVKKADRLQTREEFVHDAIEIPLLEKEKQNAELTSQNKQLNAQVDQLKTEIDQQNAELTSQNKQLNAQVDQLKNQVDQQNTQVDQLQAQIAQMQREIEKLNEQVATVTTERDTARRENGTLKMRLAKLKMLFKDFSKNFSGLSKASTIQDKADAVLAQFDRDDR